MKVILLKDVSKIGQKFEIKDVADGHALNFLIPRGLAKTANPSEIAKIESLKASENKTREDKLNNLRLKISQLLGRPILIESEANEKGHLFKGLHEKDLVKSILNQEGIEIEQDLIRLERPIKEVGSQKVKIEGEGVSAEIEFIIKAKDKS